MKAEGGGMRQDLRVRTKRICPPNHSALQGFTTSRWRSGHSWKTAASVGNFGGSALSGRLSRKIKRGLGEQVGGRAPGTGGKRALAELLVEGELMSAQRVQPLSDENNELISMFVTMTINVKRQNRA